MEEFVMVKKKSRRKRIQEEHDETSQLYFEKLLRKTLEVLDTFDEDYLLVSIISLRTMLTAIGRETKIHEIICYGLGSLSNLKSSIYQLALIIKIRAHFDCKLLLYDPAFTPADIFVLESLSCSLIEDDKGLRKVDDPTLFFLPHAPRFITENILSSNWGLNLSNCIIFGDYFELIFHNSMSRTLKESYPFLFKAIKFVAMHEVPNTFKFVDIFNDFAVHVFLPTCLAALDPATWNLRLETLTKTDLDPT